MTHLLFPGRHLLNTAFQERYLRGVLEMPLEQLTFLDEDAPPAGEPVDSILFAVTSANQQHSRYNPIPFHVRAIGVDRFARALEQSFAFTYRIAGIPHYPPTPHFAEIVLKEIREQTNGDLILTPANCVVLSSTPAVFSLFRDLGFSVLPAEHGVQGARPETPIQLVQKIVEASETWAGNREIRRKMAATSFDLWRDFPEIPRRVRRLWRDPLLTDEGGLTESRDYASYAFGMSNNEIIAVKYRDIREAIVPGKIVDEGCADGALLVRIAQEFPDSDLIGIEITGEFLARCHERQRAGQFGGAFVHFHQRNIARPIFEEETIDTTICNSTIHELWSYGEGAANVHAYFAHKFAQTRPGGRLIVRDVVGPADKERTVYMWLAHDDGSDEGVDTVFDEPQAQARHLAGLSTYARFKRFTRDFRAAERAGGGNGTDGAFPYEETAVDGKRYAILCLRDAVEFMSKKDYVDNWESEMHETFAFWEFSEWKAAAASAGFRILENPNEPAGGSRVYTNPWIVENRWQGSVALFEEADGRLRPLPYPPTNIVLVAEKVDRH